MSISHTQAFEDGPDKLSVIKFIKRFVIGLRFDIVQINKKDRCEEVFFSKRLFHTFFKVLKDISEKTDVNPLPMVWNKFLNIMLCDNVRAFY